jgi:hypothetical protein
MMGIINLADAKVSYEGETLPAINLISKLQSQLREAACRIATIAETLGDLQAALLNSHTVEARLTLSKEDYGRFKSMEGVDDNERIRKAIMTVIHPHASGISGEADTLRPAATVSEPNPSLVPVESAPMISKSAEPAPTPVPEARASVNTLREHAVTPEPVMQKKPTAQCPTCHYPIELPETLTGEWTVELQCRTCGAKCLIKPPFRQPSTTYSI